MQIIFLLFVFAISTLLFWGNFQNFFFQDDFFNMTLANNQSLVSAFNIFQKPIMDFNFYRPLTTQLFWNLGQNMFGWNQVGYHALNFGLFLVNIYLVFTLAKLLTARRLVWYLTTFFYAISASHFYRLFFLSQFQETALATFTLLTLIFFIKGKSISLITLVLALMCKETAVVIPIVLLFYEILNRRKAWKFLVLSMLVVALYLFARIFFFGFASGGAYSYNFNPKSVLNNYFWYTLWSLGIPESFVNLKLFMVTKFDDVGKFLWFAPVNPEIFTAFGMWGGPIVLTFCLLVVTTFLGMSRKIAFTRELFFGVFIFFIFLLPVAFFPFHKFAYSLAVPLFGLTFVLAYISSQQPVKFVLTEIILFIALSFFSTQYNLTHHWAVTKAYTAEKVFNYLKINYPVLPERQNIYFQNDDRNYCSPRQPAKNLSTEVAYGIGGQDGLRLFYNRPDLAVWFWDWDKYEHLDANSITLDSRLFLK